MVASQRALFLSLALAIGPTVAQAQNAAPVLDDPVQANRVAPTIPGGRVLLFPLTASDADGDRLTYTVKSSNPRILARVKTGNPFLKFTVNHAAGATQDPAYSGDLVFMLLRDWAPITSGFIGGFAQSGYYDSTVFHRLADLNDDSNPLTPALPPSFIFQGGDPLGTGLGGPGMTGNAPATSWKFDNELDPALMFVGRGQLAMANTGTNAQVFSGTAFGDFKDSNGSQFFITDAQPRHLDFKHTIFAQLVRGWELLPSLRNTKTTNSAPDVPVTLTGASVVPTSGVNNTDAVLVLSATGKVTSTITVTVNDGRGGTATKTFEVMGEKETINAPPFLRKVAPLVTPKDTVVFFNLEPTDLEHDFLDTRHFVLQGFPSGGATSSGAQAGLRPAAGDDGLVSMGFDVAQFDVGQQAFASARLATNAFIGVGDRIALGERVLIEGAPGVAVSGVVGKIRDFDPASLPGDFTATINWGDGTRLDTGTLARDTASAGLSMLTVTGTHTYARAGVYSVVVNFTGNKGVIGVARGQAVISSAAIRAAGEVLQIAGAAVKNRVIATFFDSASTDMPGDYSALVDWGDGAWSDGVVESGAGGRFIVRGTHTYRDAERYAIHVRIRRKSDPPGLNDAWAWSSVALAFTAAPHLPPFPKPNLTVAWLPVGLQDLGKSFTGVPGSNYRVQVSGNFIIINSGNRTMPACAIRYWLSSDRVLSKTTDKPVLARLPGVAAFGPQLNLTNFRAGASTGSTGVTLQLPKNQSGGRQFIITELSYHDPLTDVEAIDKEFASPQIDPAIVLAATSNPRTTESGGTATVTVTLDTLPVLPTANIASITPGNPVTINTSTAHGLATGEVAVISGVVGSSPDINGPRTVTVVDADTFTVAVEVTVAGTGGKVDGTVTIPLASSLPTEGTVSPSQLVFTTANWNLPQTVTATGVDDAPPVRDGPRNYVIQLGAIISADTLYRGINPPDFTLTNLDNEP